MSYAGSLLFTAIIYVAFGIYDHCVIPLVTSRKKAPPLPDRAPRLQALETIDRVYIALSKLVTALFVYHSAVFIMDTERSGMDLDVLSPRGLLRCVAMLPVHLAVLFVVYDFFYTLFHWALHWPPLYALVHKHHHRQMCPFRGNTDAINVHPFEYITGEYNHLFALWILTKLFGHGIHPLTYVVFIFVGGTLASLNHTRFDVQVPFVYNVNVHDLHHRQYRCNYGQYIMFWDHVFGTYVPYSAKVQVD